MSRWFRAYDDALDDPKVQCLSGDLFKAWFNLMCVTSKNDGQPFDLKEVAFRLRVKPTKAQSIVDALVAAGLLDVTDDRYVSHNWDSRQFKSDVTDPTAAERMKRYRKNRKSVTENTVTVTPTRAETEQNRKKDGADAPPVEVDEDADLFRRGKEVLGQNAGSLVAKLKKSKGGISQARAVIEQASTKENPREYVGRAIAGPARAVTREGNPYPEGII